MAMELAEYLLLSRTSSLTLNMCGIVKELVSIGLAHVWAGDELTPMNVLGLALCIGGIALHVRMKARVDERRKTQETDNACKDGVHLAALDRLELLADDTSSDYGDE